MVYTSHLDFTAEHNDINFLDNPEFVSTCFRTEDPFLDTVIKSIDWASIKHPVDIWRYGIMRASNLVTERKSVTHFMQLFSEDENLLSLSFMHWLCIGALNRTKLAGYSFDLLTDEFINHNSLDIVGLSFDNDPHEKILVSRISLKENSQINPESLWGVGIR